MFIIPSIILVIALHILLVTVGSITITSTANNTRKSKITSRVVVLSILAIMSVVILYTADFSYEVSYQPLDDENGGWEVVQARDYTSIHALGVTKFYNRDTDDIFDKAYADAMYQKYRRCFVIEYKNVFGKIINRTVVLSKKEL